MIELLKLSSASDCGSFSRPFLENIRISVLKCYIQNVQSHSSGINVSVFFLFWKFVTTCVDKGRQQQHSTNNHPHYLQVILYIKVYAYYCCVLFTNYHYGDQITVNETGTACCMQPGTDDQSIQNFCWTVWMEYTDPVANRMIMRHLNRIHLGGVDSSGSTWSPVAIL
jgi:hypothetical protein